MAQSEGAAWRKLLQPVVTGIVALMAAATLYLQRQDSGSMDSRVAALEVRADASDKRSDRFSVDIDNFKVMLSDIRSDVSFIRGKMEGGK